MVGTSPFTIMTNILSLMFAEFSESNLVKNISHRENMGGNDIQIPDVVCVT